MQKRSTKVLCSGVVSAILLVTVAGCGSNSSGGNSDSSPAGQGSSNASSSHPIVLKLGHTLSPQNQYQLTAEYFANLVKQGTGDKVEVQIYPESQLGGEVQMTEALRTGTQDMEITSQAPVVNTDKSWEVLSLPYLFDSIDQGNKVLQGPTGKEFLDQLGKYNIHGLAWLSVMERDMFSRKPIKTESDMNGMKIRVLQDPGYVDAYKALGANPTPMAYNELYMAMQQGTVDGGDTSPDQMVQDKFYEVAKNFSLSHVNYLPAALLISDSTWSKLTPDEQKVIQDAANKAAQYDIRIYNQAYTDSISQLKQKGVSVWPVNTQPWQQSVQPFVQQEVQRIPNGTKLYQDIVNAEKQ